LTIQGGHAAQTDAGLPGSTLRRVCEYTLAIQPLTPQQMGGEKAGAGVLAWVFFSLVWPENILRIVIFSGYILGWLIFHLGGWISGRKRWGEG